MFYYQYLIIITRVLLIWCDVTLDGTVNGPCKQIKNYAHKYTNTNELTNEIKSIGIKNTHNKFILIHLHTRLYLVC